MGSLRSMKILEDFLNTDMKLFEGLEITMQGILCAAVKISVESVVESLVSRYEKHFDKSRKLTEENALDEMEISANGPQRFKMQLFSCEEGAKTIRTLFRGEFWGQ